VSDECFYSSNQVAQAVDGKTYATETGNEVTWEDEENWKFRLGAFADKLTQWASVNGSELSFSYRIYERSMPEGTQALTDIPSNPA
jgi:methionyl-tRNA synthetase